MKIWPAQDAEAHFKELLEACMTQGPQVMAQHGVEIAVLVSAQEWRRLESAARPSLKQLLLSDTARTMSLASIRGNVAPLYGDRTPSRQAPNRWATFMEIRTRLGPVQDDPLGEREQSTQTRNPFESSKE